MKIQIHKNKIYITPRPKKDIKEGLIVMLNKPRVEGAEPFIVRDIEENQKEYPLPTLPEGVFIVKAFIKDDRKQNPNLFE